MAGKATAESTIVGSDRGRAISDVFLVPEDKEEVVANLSSKSNASIDYRAVLERILNFEEARGSYDDEQDHYNIWEVAKNPDMLVIFDQLKGIPYFRNNVFGLELHKKYRQIVKGAASFVDSDSGSRQIIPTMILENIGSIASLKDGGATKLFHIGNRSRYALKKAIELLQIGEPKKVDLLLKFCDGRSGSEIGVYSDLLLGRENIDNSTYRRALSDPAESIRIIGDVPMRDKEVFLPRDRVGRPPLTDLVRRIEPTYSFVDREDAQYLCSLFESVDYRTRAVFEKVLDATDTGQMSETDRNITFEFIVQRDWKRVLRSYSDKQVRDVFGILEQDIRETPAAVKRLDSNAFDAKYFP